MRFFGGRGGGDGAGDVGLTNEPPLAAFFAGAFFPAAFLAAAFFAGLFAAFFAAFLAGRFFAAFFAIDIDVLRFGCNR